MKLITSVLIIIFFIKGNTIKIKYNTFRINLEKVELLSYDKRVIDVDLIVFKYNRTVFASNATVIIKQDISRDTIVNVRTYEFLNNVYKPFAVNNQKKYCAFIEDEYAKYFYDDFNTGGDESHLFPKKCPTPIGKYVIKNYVPNAGNYPMELPFKKFMIESKVFYHRRLITQFRYYLSLDRDVVYREIFG